MNGSYSSLTDLDLWETWTGTDSYTYNPSTTYDQYSLAGLDYAHGAFQDITSMGSGAISPLETYDYQPEKTKRDLYSLNVKDIYDEMSGIGRATKVGMDAIQRDYGKMGGMKSGSWNERLSKTKQGYVEDIQNKRLELDTLKQGAMTDIETMRAGYIEGLTGAYDAWGDANPDDLATGQDMYECYERGGHWMSPFGCQEFGEEINN